MASVTLVMAVQYIFCKRYFTTYHTFSIGLMPGEFLSHSKQWCSQSKILGGAKYFDFKRATVFVLRHRLSKHKKTKYAVNLGGHGRFLQQDFAYASKMLTLYLLKNSCTCFKIRHGERTC